MSFALQLVEQLPRTLALLAGGEIEEYKAYLISQATVCLTEEQARAVEGRVLERAVEQMPAQLKAALAKAVLVVDPQGSEERRQAKKADRRVCAQPTEDGEAVLSIYHSAAKVAAMRAAIRGRALQLKNGGGETRTLAQVEADVAVDLVLGSAEHQRVEVHLTVPLTPGGVPEVDGVGPITVQAARELAAEATTWRWLRTDPETGAVTDLTAPSYQPPAALAEFVRVRDRTCRYPGCVRPARQCDIDHRTPWPGGATCEANCQCLCRRHHRAKHEGGWRVEQLKPGFLQWISPLGSLQLVGPEPVSDPEPDPPPF